MKECECGEIIKATSESQLKYCYDSHCKGIKHKKKMNLKKEMSKHGKKI